MPTVTVPASFALTLLDDIEAIGHSPERLLSDLDLPFSYRDLREGKVQLIPNELFIKLFKGAVNLQYHHTNPQREHLPMRIEELHMLCYCIINCENLEQVICRAASFNEMLGDRVANLSLTRTSEDATFRLDTTSNSGLLTDMAGLSTFHGLFSWLIGESIPISAYGVTYTEHPNRASLARLFHHPILYSQPYNFFRFPSDYLSKVVVKNYQQLTEFLSALPYDTMLNPKAESLFSEAIEQMITASLHNNVVPTIGEFAAYFKMSNATFRRRLTDEGTSFSELRDRCRRTIAIDLLSQNPEMNITDIAIQLGYNDTRAFRRAFRSWTGHSPSEYRSQIT